MSGNVAILWGTSRLYNLAFGRLGALSLFKKNKHLFHCLFNVGIRTYTYIRSPSSALAEQRDRGLYKQQLPPASTFWSAWVL